MMKLGGLLAELDETQITQRVALRHDEARGRYRLDHNTVRDFERYLDILGNYYNYHYGAAVLDHGRLPEMDARGYAKQIVQRYYEHKYQGNLASAFHDASSGSRGGLRTQIDLIAETLKGEAVERYVQDVLDRYIVANDWEGKVEIIRQFLKHFRLALPKSIEFDKPERYARDYRELIRAFVSALQETSDIFRRG